MPRLRGTSFDDRKVRNAVISFFKEKFNIFLEFNKIICYLYKKHEYDINNYKHKNKTELIIILNNMIEKLYYPIKNNLILLIIIKFFKKTTVC